MDDELRCVACGALVHDRFKCQECGHEPSDYFIDAVEEERPRRLGETPSDYFEETDG